MAPKRRTFIVGARYEVGMEETVAAPDPAVVHVGDPPFLMRIAAPDDPGERMIGLSDGWFLTDLVWLGTRRANGRLLDGLLAAAADAAEMDLGDEGDLEDEDGGEDLPFGEYDEDLTPADILVEAFIEDVNDGLTGPVGLLDYADAAAYGRVEPEESRILPFDEYRRALGMIEEEAEMRGVEIRRQLCDPDAYFVWAEAAGLTNGPEAR
ncbi:MAG TPA: hypothetical protein VK943_04990, partial [Arenibaculum sp.]|nr:hypothetical protein [Arenibaculum sp.]